MAPLFTSRLSLELVLTNHAIREQDLERSAQTMGRVLSSRLDRKGWYGQTIHDRHIGLWDAHYRRAKVRKNLEQKLNGYERI